MMSSASSSVSPSPTRRQGGHREMGRTRVSALNPSSARLQGLGFGGLGFRV